MSRKAVLQYKREEEGLDRGGIICSTFLLFENDLDPFGYSVPEGILAHTGINVDGEIEIKYIFGGGL